MWRFYAAVALVWLALMPPLFTGGACTAEFDTETERVSRDSGRLRTAESARDYFRSRDVPVSQVFKARGLMVTVAGAPRCGCRKSLRKSQTAPR